MCILSSVLNICMIYKRDIYMWFLTNERIFRGAASAIIGLMNFFLGEIGRAHV